MYIFLLIFIGIFGCTPKISQPVAETQNEAPVVAKQEAGPCSTFDQASDKETAMNAHVIYRDFLRANNYEEAFPYWERAYQLAPGADGKRNTHYADGIKFYEHFLSQEEDPEKRKEYVDRIFAFYDEIEACYGEEGYVSGLKAFDLYYKYKDRSTKDEIYKLFTKSMNIDGMKANYFILNPFTDLLVRRFQAEEIPMPEAQKYAKMVADRLAEGMKSDENKPQWQIINEYLPQRLEAFEGSRGFYDCNYFTEKYFQLFLEDSTNCEVIEDVHGKMRWGGCDSTHIQLAMVAAAAKRHCSRKVEHSDAKKAYLALREGNYEEAISLFQIAADNASDLEKKSNYLFIIAKIYNAHLKNFPLSRKFALEAASHRPNWGEPYVLIGRLYASSGPLCGPGRGWDSQIVVWPAIDKWAYAKRIDPSVAEEANKWIGRYSQYMPSREDVFQRTLQQGQSFKVGCWIQENTTIRSPK